MEAEHEGYVPVAGAELYYRELGKGLPAIVLHGGPDFDHSYLLPEMDRLSDLFRLVYYDQRGRGKSGRDVRPADVTMRSDVEDLEKLRAHLQARSISLLGHSWGALLAMEYAIRYPHHVSRLILLNPAPASHDDLKLFRQARLEATPSDMEELKARLVGAGYMAGEPDAVAEYYRVHFRRALRQPEHLDTLIQRLRSSFTQEGILRAREIESGLLRETWLSGEYDLLPKLRLLGNPALVVHGDHDFIPLACSMHIARAIPGARFVLLKDCGHFSYLECPDQVGREIRNFLRAVQ